jgi:RNA polymerase sigma factor (sigma-70 family)
MSADKEFPDGAELVATAAQSRAADREMAVALGRPEPAGPAATAGYLDALERRTALAPERERELVLAAQSGDAAARARLVETFMPLIAASARVYRESPRIDRLELLQEGVLGLLRALERFEPERGVPFWGYAAFWVRQAMQQLVAELTRPMVLSDRGLRHLARLKDAHREAVRETGREPGRDELVQRSGLTDDQVDGLLLAERPARSTDEPVEAHDGALGTFGDLLVDPLAETEYERVLETIGIQQLLALLSALSDREREILRGRYGLDGDEESLRQIGARLGLSAERVRQLEQRALGKLAAASGVPAS